MKAIMVDTNNLTHVIEMPKKTDYKWYAKEIGCDWIEVVHPEKLPHGYVMIVDEEGLLKDNKLNIYGSWLYGTEHHGQPIVGNILIVGEKHFDLCGLTDTEIVTLLNILDESLMEEEDE